MQGKKIKRTAFLILSVFLIAGCQKGDMTTTDFETIPGNRFYADEILPDEYLTLYGHWKLDQVTGGFSGAGYDADFTHLVIRETGIYGIIKDDQLLEYGKLKLHDPEEVHPGFTGLYAGFIDKYTKGEPHFHFKKSFSLDGDRLVLGVPNGGCMYTHYFVKVKSAGE